MALFSTLLSASKEQSSISSAHIPTLIQLYHSKCVSLENEQESSNNKAGGTGTTTEAQHDHHAVLTYQAMEVTPPDPEGESKLFGQRRKNKNVLHQKPNLGVWNCCVTVSSPSSSSNSNSSNNNNNNTKDQHPLVDSLLTIPDPTRHYCLTVDLTDPSEVEPTLSTLHNTLVRLLIQRDLTSATTATTHDDNHDEKQNHTTSLLQLKSTQFGLASKDTYASTMTPSEADGEIGISLLICVLLDTSSSSVPSSSGAATSGSSNNQSSSTDINNNTNKKAETYKETQAQNLVIYHLRKYVAALNCTLCFVGTASEHSPVQPVPYQDMSRLLQLWISSSSNDTTTSELKATYPMIFLPNEHNQDDLIESVLLRNAQFAGEWDAETDSLWKALPPMESLDDDDSNTKNKNNKIASGDQAWLMELRESCGPTTVATTQTATTAPAPAAAETKDAAVTSFFEDLLKK